MVVLEVVLVVLGAINHIGFAARKEALIWLIGFIGGRFIGFIGFERYKPYRF